MVVDRSWRRFVELNPVAHLLNFRVLFFEVRGEILLLPRDGRFLFCYSRV
jgi:hypothetical protein